MKPTTVARNATVPIPTKSLKRQIVGIGKIRPQFFDRINWIFRMKGFQDGHGNDENLIGDNTYRSSIWRQRGSRRWWIALLKSGRSDFGALKPMTPLKSVDPGMPIPSRSSRCPQSIAQSIDLQRETAGRLHLRPAGRNYEQILRR